MDIQSTDNAIKILMGDYFKRKRHECGLTGKETGQLLCLSQQHVSRYERCETSIPLSTMIFFLKSNNFELDDFFNYLSEGIYMTQEKIDNNHCDAMPYQIFLRQDSNIFKTEKVTNGLIK